jgi:glyoxylase-like metal-dependent hydrolase (beta-lactamase superfamily II)
MSDWFRTTEVAKGIHLTTEPWVHSFFRANCYTVQGRDADLQFDFGSGLRPYRAALPLSGAPVLAVASHAHIDHVGGFAEFDTRLGHAEEAEGFATMSEIFTLKHLFRDEVFGRSLSRDPAPGFRLAAWDLAQAPLTGTLAEGDKIDLGDRCFTVLHLPGHSPGGIALLDEADGLILAGDAIYEGGLVDDIPGASVSDYLATMARLANLDCRLVLAGHGALLDREAMRALALGYIRSKD